MQVTTEDTDRCSVVTSINFMT